MGVIGLTSLIEVNPHLLSDVKLRDTNLVVDGNSFCYQVYNASRIDSRFGGDYPKFEEVILNLLDQFESCNIRLTFVFDGLLDLEALKRNTALQRQKTRLLTAKSIASLTSRANLLPLLALDVLISTLTDRQIEVYQCAGEADGVAVALANDRRAPLLSQDSDFFIFDLNSGYIPFERLEWNVDRRLGDASPTVLRADLYRLDNLLEHYPAVNRRLLPLFAFLCGNDFSAGCNMSKFFDHIHRPQVEIAGGHEASSRKRRSNKGNRPMRRHCNMIAVLEWLRGKNDEEKTIEEALNWIELQHREKVRQAVYRSMAAYRRSEIVENSLNDPSTSFDPAAITKQRISHLNLPQWLINHYVIGKSPAILLHVRQDRRIFLPALIEDFSKPSAYACCQSLRLAVYHILLKREPAGRRFVTEYSRDGGNFAKRLLSVDDEQRVLSALPDLADVEKLDVADRRRLLLDCFQFTATEEEIVSNFPPSLFLFVSSFLFWCRSEETAVKRSQAAALLISLLCFCNRKNRSDPDDRPLFSSGDEQLQNVELEFDYTPALSTKRHTFLAIANVHSFSQWQACFQASLWLDTLLMHPFGPAVSARRLFHGRVVYNLTAFLEKSKSEAAALEHLFKDKPLTANVFNELWRLFQSYVPEKDSSTCGKKNASKGRNRKPIAAKVVVSTVVDSASDVSDKEDAGSSDDGWGLENRFRTLVSLK